MTNKGKRMTVAERNRAIKKIAKCVVESPFNLTEAIKKASEELGMNFNTAWSLYYKEIVNSSELYALIGKKEGAFNRKVKKVNSYSETVLQHIGSKFTTRDFIQSGLTQNVLHVLTKQGRIKRIKRGLYAQVVKPVESPVTKFNPETILKLKQLSAEDRLSIIKQLL